MFRRAIVKGCGMTSIEVGQAATFSSVTSLVSSSVTAIPSLNCASAEHVGDDLVVSQTHPELLV
jgi:hypothetical protein